MRLPQPPGSKDIEDIHKSVTDIVNFLGLMHENGTAHPAFTQDQINQMTQLTQAGKMVFNSTTGKQQKSNVVSGAVVWSDVG